jgi:hypothetical protein
MKVSEILRAVKPIDRELHDALEYVLKSGHIAHYNGRAVGAVIILTTKLYYGSRRFIRQICPK